MTTLNTIGQSLLHYHFGTVGKLFIKPVVVVIVVVVDSVVVVVFGCGIAPTAIVGYPSYDCRRILSRAQQARKEITRLATVCEG